jgi:hypothetical protein
LSPDRLLAARNANQYPSAVEEVIPAEQPNMLSPWETDGTLGKCVNSFASRGPFSQVSPPEVSALKQDLTIRRQDCYISPTRVIRLI